MDYRYNIAQSEMGAGLTEACVALALIALIAVVALPKIGSGASRILECDAAHGGIGRNAAFYDHERWVENCLSYDPCDESPFNC